MPLAKPSRHKGLANEGLLRMTGLLAGLAGLAAIGGVIWFNFTHTPIEVDKETLCPKAGPWTTTVVLIDVSDSLPPVAQEDVKNQIGEQVHNTPKFGLLELRLLDPASEGGRVLFSRCNPGDGRDLSEIIANPAQERKRFEEGFEKPLTDLLASAVAADPSQSSPIMETIQWIAVKQFARAGEQKDKPRLVVVSDMIQHSDNYSLYTGDATFERYRRSSSYEVLRTDLHQAGVTVFLVHRKNSPGLADSLVAFWEQWFADNKGTLDRVRKVQGAE